MISQPEARGSKLNERNPAGFARTRSTGFIEARSEILSEGENMPDTGERREISKRVNAKEAEVAQESRKLASRTKELTAEADARNRARSAGTNKRKSTRNP